MNKINELVEVSQLLCAVMDETDREVYSFRFFVLDRGPTISTTPEFFFQHFKGFNIEFIGAHQIFELTKKVQGITFSTRVKDLSGLKINKLLQKENVKVKRNKKSLRALACE